jgi:hypothetical protein
MAPLCPIELSHDNEHDEWAAAIRSQPQSQPSLVFLAAGIHPTSEFSR